jgi:hypothetical protein
MKRVLLLAATHGLVLGIGFALGVYTLPILIAPAGPAVAEVEAMASKAQFQGRFRRDLPGSDLLHWGEGEVSVGPEAVSLRGRLAPGPDYRLYLAPEYVDTEDAFLRIKGRSQEIGPVSTFENFIVPLPASVDLTLYDSVVVWCESFGQFITAARYR